MNEKLIELLRQAFQLGQQWVQDINNGDEPENFNSWVEKQSLQPKEQPKQFEDALQEQINNLPFTKHLDDGQYNDGQIVGFEIGARWAKSFEPKEQVNQVKLPLSGESKLSAEEKINELIDSVKLNDSNISYILQTGKINGSLLYDLRRVLQAMHDFANNSKAMKENAIEAKPNILKDWCIESLVNDYISRHRSSFVELDIPTFYKKDLLYKLGISTDILDY